MLHRISCIFILTGLSARVIMTMMTMYGNEINKNAYSFCERQ